MLTFLNGIRRADKQLSVKKQLINTAAITLLGILLGTFSKFMDSTPINHFPAFFEVLDIVNFFGRFAIWVLLAVCISVYSASPIRAAINVFLFFVGMVASYYLYSTYIAGFFPRNYAIIWFGFTAISPALAFVCWYAKGHGKISLVLASGIIAVLFNMAFVYRVPDDFRIYSALELLVFICGCVVLRRQTAKESAIMMAIGVVLAATMHMVIPFYWG